MPGRAVALDQDAAGDGDQGEADRHVDPEDPVPGEAVDDGAADQRAEGDAEAADAGPDAERDAALAGGKASDSSVSVSGATMAAPAPWTARAAISAPVVGASAARRRGDGEDAEADEEHAPAAEAIAEGGGGEEQDGEG